MKRLFAVISALALLASAQTAFCDSNPVALGTEKITKMPFSMVKGANDHLFSPVKDINHAALDFTDNARAAVVSVGLNLGQPVEG